MGWRSILSSAEGRAAADVDCLGELPSDGEKGSNWGLEKLGFRGDRERPTTRNMAKSWRTIARGRARGGRGVKREIEPHLRFRTQSTGAFAECMARSERRSDYTGPAWLIPDGAALLC